MIKSFHIIAFVVPFVVNELPGSFTEDTIINVAEVTSNYKRLIR